MIVFRSDFSSEIGVGHITRCSTLASEFSSLGYESCLIGPGDLGRVIGRRGRTAQSIRTLVRAAAAKDGREVDVDFVD